MKLTLLANWILSPLGMVSSLQPRKAGACMGYSLQLPHQVWQEFVPTLRQHMYGLWLECRTCCHPGRCSAIQSTLGRRRRHR